MKRASAKPAPKPSAPVLAAVKPGDALLIVTPHTLYIDVVVEADAESVKARVGGRLRRSDGTSSRTRFDGATAQSRSCSYSGRCR